MNENLNIKGRIKLAFFKNGLLQKESFWIDNVITDAGKTALASLLNSTNTGESLVTHMGFGSGTATPSASDTTLGAELTTSGYSRIDVTRSNPSTNIIQYVGVLTDLTAEALVQEVGLFSASVDGVLFAHQLTGPVTISTSEDSLQITWQIIFT